MELHNGKVRMAELSRITGVSVPNIKYYVREDLLAPDEAISKNQALYGQGVSWRSRRVRECQRHFRQDPKNSPARPYLEGHTSL